MRNVYFDFSDPEASGGGCQFGGFALEHNATTLRVKLPEDFFGDAVRHLHFDFETALGETVATQPVTPVDHVVSAALFQQLTQAGMLRFQVVARGENDRIIAKTPVGQLRIDAATYGDPVVIDEQPYRVDQQILNCLTQAQNAVTDARAAASDAHGAAIDAQTAAQEAAGHFPIDGSDIAFDAIRSAHIHAGAVTAAKMADNAVTTAALKNGAVTEDKLADGGVSAAKLANGAVTAGKLAAGAVTEAALANGSVASPKLANAAVTGEKLAAGAVTGEKIGGFAVSPDKTDFVTGQIQRGTDLEHAVGGAAFLVESPRFPVTPGKRYFADMHMGNPPYPEIRCFDAGGTCVAQTGFEEMFFDTWKCPEGVTAISFWRDETEPTPYPFEEVGVVLYEAPYLLRMPGLVVDSGNLQDDAVIASKIKNKNVTTNKIADNAVTEEKLAEAVQTKLNRNASAIPATYDGQPTNVQDYLNGIVQNVTGQFGAVEQRFGQVEADKQALWNAVNTGAGYLQQLAEALGGKMERRVVDALPASGEANVLYVLRGAAFEELGDDVIERFNDGIEQAIWRYVPGDYYVDAQNAQRIAGCGNDTGSQLVVETGDVGGKRPFHFDPAIAARTVYLAPSGGPLPPIYKAKTVYTLYLYIDGAWVSLSDYYTKAEIDEKLAGRINEGITVCRHAAVTGRNAAGSNVVAVNWTKFYIPVDPAALVGRDPYLRVTLTIDDAQGEPFLGYTEIRLRANSVEYKYKIQPEIGIKAPGDYPLDIPLAAFVNGNQSVLEQTSPITSFFAFGYGKENAPAGRYSLTLSDLRITREAA
jgi:hypothetical protein